MTPAPQSEPELPPAVFRELILTGSPLALALPDVCARCGQPAPKRLYWDKVIDSYDSDSGYTHEVVGARAPFCGRCLERHEREIRRMPVWKQLLQMFRSRLMYSAALAGVAAIVAAIQLIPNPVNAQWSDVVMFAGIVGLFTLISLGSLFGAWRSTRAHRVPPVTAIAGSFSFSEDISEMFEGERHRYVMVNDAFFEALLAANRDKVWKPGSGRARRASWIRKVLYVAAGVGIGVVVLWDWIQPWVRVEW
jgi:hypothetical protein